MAKVQGISLTEVVWSMRFLITGGALIWTINTNMINQIKTRNTLQQNSIINFIIDFNIIEKIFVIDYDDRLLDYCVVVVTFPGALQSGHVLVSNRLRNANLSINLDKSKFCAERLGYLGYVLSPKGIGTNEYKIGAILHFPDPMSVTQLRQFLGMVGWFRRFIPHFASIAKPLTDLLKGSPRGIVWNDKAEQSFTELKKLLTSAPILKLPDYSQPFTVRSYASDVGAGGILLQGSGDDER
uniref:RNA-directed DNA polymerase n=1 Tax=Phlebotomus papatasi TaxID=29031 RepID=A0A1B0EZ71_PHLPP